MSNVNAEIKWQGNDNAWFSTNASTVYPANIQIFHTDGRYKFTDGVTTLGALSFLGGLSYTLTASEIGSVINSANSATPNDTDLVMSVDTSVAKKNTWTQIKTFLKTYFDTVYATITDLTGYVKKGTLTTNTIPKATSSDTIGDSQITENGIEFAVTYSGQSIFYGDATEAFIGLSTNEFVDVIAARTEIKHSTEIKLNSPVINTQLTASQIVETDASKNLVSAAKGTAYNKNFGTGTANIVEIGSTLSNSQITSTDANGKLQTLTTSTYPSLTELAYIKGLTSSIQTQLDGKLSSTKEQLLTIGGFASFSPADATTYYFGEYLSVTGASLQNTFKFQFNDNFTITKVIIELRCSVNASNESVAFYLRESATTDNTITTSLDMSTIGANTNKVFVYTPTISVSSGLNYEFKIVTPAWVTNPTVFIGVVKLYGY